MISISSIIVYVADQEFELFSEGWVHVASNHISFIGNDENLALICNTERERNISYNSFLVEEGATQ